MARATHQNCICQLDHFLHVIHREQGKPLYWEQQSHIGEREEEDVPLRERKPLSLSRQDTQRDYNMPDAYWRIKEATLLYIHFPVSQKLARAGSVIGDERETLSI